MREIDDAGYTENDRETGSDEKQRASAREPGDKLNEVEAQDRAPAVSQIGRPSFSANLRESASLLSDIISAYFLQD
jgi:hypothetical protein